MRRFINAASRAKSLFVERIHASNRFRFYAIRSKPLAFMLACLPLLWLAGRAGFGDLGVNPIETLNRFLGDWALRMLLAALAVSPLRRLTGWSDLARLRRMLGLFAFFYVCLHVACYVGLDLGGDLAALGRDLLKRRYIAVGMIALALLIPLALTSTDAMIRKMGGQAWRRLHLLVFPAAICGVIHHTMMVRNDYTPPLLHGAALALLLAERLWAWRRRRLRRAPPAVRA